MLYLLLITLLVVFVLLKMAGGKFSSVESYEPKKSCDKTISHPAGSNDFDAAVISALKKNPPTSSFKGTEETVSQYGENNESSVCVTDERTLSGVSLSDKRVESDGTCYRFCESEITTRVALFHSSNKVLMAEGGFVRKDGSSRFVTNRIYKSDKSLYNIAYSADLRNFYLDKSLIIFSDSVDNLRANIEQVFKEWATLAEIQEKEDAMLQEKKISLAQAYLKRNLPKLRELFIEGDSENYKSLYYRVKKRVDFLSGIEGALDRDNELSFKALDEPEHSMPIKGTGHPERNYIISEVKGLYYRSREAQFAACLLEVGDEVALEQDFENERDCFAIKVLTADNHFIGYLDRTINQEVFYRFKKISSCRVIRRTNHSIPYITVRIEFNL